jgi:hypothetical protein
MYIQFFKISFWHEQLLPRFDAGKPAKILSTYLRTSKAGAELESGFFEC